MNPSTYEPRHERRRGAALLLTLATMTILGVVIAGALFASMREYRDAQAALHRTRALTAAEDGLYRAMTAGEWNPLWNTTPVRGLLTLRAHELDQALDTVRIWKLTTTTFALTSESVAGRGRLPARRRVGLLAALRVPHFDPLAAVTAREQVTVAGNAAITGADTTLENADCPPAGPPLAAIAIPDSLRIDVNGCEQICLSGEPSVLATPGAGADVMYDHFGTVGRTELAARGRLLPTGTTLTPIPSLDIRGACDVTNPRNLGDPRRELGAEAPCAAYYPVITVPGSLRITGGAGSGALIVDGNLTLDAGTEFVGFVITRGTLDLTGGAQLYGAALATRVHIDGGARIQLSRCAVAHALLSAAVPIIPRGASWFDAY